MKNGLIIFSILFLITGQTIKSQTQPDVKVKNEYIAALLKINSTYSSFSKKVDSLSNELSKNKKERAAFFLAKAYSLSIECYVEIGDPANPGLTDWMSPTRKFRGDNPYTSFFYL